MRHFFFVFTVDFNSKKQVWLVGTVLRSAFELRQNDHLLHKHRHTETWQSHVKTELQAEYNAFPSSVTLRMNKTQCQPTESEGTCDALEQNNNLKWRSTDSQWWVNWKICYFNIYTVYIKSWYTSLMSVLTLTHVLFLKHFLVPYSLKASLLVQNSALRVSNNQRWYNQPSWMFFVSTFKDVCRQ